MAKHRGVLEHDFAGSAGTVHMVAGRQVKFVRARYGYAAWLLDIYGRPALPVPTGHTLNLTKAIAHARAFLEKLR